MTARELWWTSQKFYPDGIFINTAVHDHVITRGMNNRPVGDSCSETQSHPTDMINESTYSWIRFIYQLLPRCFIVHTTRRRESQFRVRYVKLCLVEQNYPSQN
jgi:hypothetical protein